MSTSTTSPAAYETVQDSVGCSIKRVSEVKPRNPRASDRLLGTKGPHLVWDDVGSNVLTLDHVHVRSERGSDGIDIGPADVDVDHRTIGIDRSEPGRSVPAAEGDPWITAQVIVQARMDVPVPVVCPRAGAAPNLVELARGRGRGWAGNGVDQPPRPRRRHRATRAGLKRVRNDGELFHGDDPLLPDPSSP